MILILVVRVTLARPLTKFHILDDMLQHKSLDKQIFLFGAGPLIKREFKLVLINKFLRT